MADSLKLSDISTIARHYRQISSQTACFDLPNDRERAAIRQQLGHQIRPMQQSDSTSDRKITVIVITLLALSAIAAIACITLGALTGLAPLLVVGGIAACCALIAGGVLVSQISKKKGPDSRPPSSSDQQLDWQEIFQRGTTGNLITERVLDPLLEGKTAEEEENLYWWLNGHLRCCREVTRATHEFQQSIRQQFQQQTEELHLTVQTLNLSKEETTQLQAGMRQEQTELETLVQSCALEAVNLITAHYQAILEGQQIFAINRDVQPPPAKKNPIKYAVKTIGNYPSVRKNRTFTTTIQTQDGQQQTVQRTYNLWENICDQMGEHVTHLPQLVLVELLQYTSPRRCQELLNIPDEMLDHLSTIKSDLFHLTEEEWTYLIKDLSRNPNQPRMKAIIASIREIYNGTGHIPKETCSALVAVLPQ